MKRSRSASHRAFIICLALLAYLFFVNAPPSNAFLPFGKSKDKTHEGLTQYSQKDFNRLFGLLNRDCREAWRDLIENDVALAKGKFESLLGKNPQDTFLVTGHLDIKKLDSNLRSKLINLSPKF